MTKATPTDSQNKTTQTDAEKHSATKRDLIDETVWESFPASDAPGSWAGRDIPPEVDESVERKKS